MEKRFGTAQLRAELQEAVDAAGGVRAWARTHKVSAQYVCEVLLEQRPASDRIARVLGYKKCPIEYTLLPG